MLTLGNMILSLRSFWLFWAVYIGVVVGGWGNGPFGMVTKNHLTGIKTKKIPFVPRLDFFGNRARLTHGNRPTTPMYHP